MPGGRELTKRLETNDIAVKDAMDWVVRGWERPRPAGAAASADAALVAPTHALPETNASTGTVLTEYLTGPQVRPKGEQP